MKKKKLVIGAIIQARCNSIRLPNKVLFEINNVPCIEILVKRLQKSKKLKRIIVATTTKKTDDKLVKFLVKNIIICLAKAVS